MFDGWLLKVGGTVFPMEYIQANTYKVRPDQRLDSSAERDITGTLHRNVVEHMPTKIEFETMPIDNEALGKIYSLYKSGWTSELQRQLDITYYNPESDSYKTGTFYMPDAEYNVKEIRSNTIMYAPVRYAFIEY